MSSMQAEVTRPAPAFANLAKATNFIIPVAIGVILWFIPRARRIERQSLANVRNLRGNNSRDYLAPLPMSAVALIGATVATLLGGYSL